jgi:hypothetical protein
MSHVPDLCMQASLWLVVSAAASVLLGIAFLQLFKYQPHLMTKATIATQVNKCVSSPEPALWQYARLIQVYFCCQNGLLSILTEGNVHLSLCFKGMCASLLACCSTK